MAKGKYIIRAHLSLIFILFLLNASTTQANAWLPKEGDYNISIGGQMIDAQSRKMRDYRKKLFIMSQTAIEKSCVDISEIYIEANIRRDEEIWAALRLTEGWADQVARLEYINAVIAQPLLHNTENIEIKVKNEIIKAFAKESETLASFSEDSSSYLELEYGIRDYLSFGGKLGYNVNKFTQIKPKKDNSVKSAQEIDIFYKYKIYDNSNWIITFSPKLHFSSKNIYDSLKHVDLSLLIGRSKIKDNPNNYMEWGFTLRQYYSQVIGHGVGFIMNMQEAAEIGKGFTLNNYTEYEQVKFKNFIYSRILYDQLSVGKKIFIDRLKAKCFTANIGYFWKTSLADKRYIMSGPVFSVQFNL